MVTSRLLEAFLACAAAGLEHLPAMGMATCDLTAGEMGHFKFYGQVRDLDTTVDGYYYASNTPGAFGTAAGDTSQVVAWANPAADGMGFLDFERVAHNHETES